MEAPIENTFDIDYQQKTLDWAASVPDSQPSERLAFIKKFLGICTQDELRRLKKMVQIKRRRNFKDERLACKQTEIKFSEAPTSSSAVTTFSDAASPLGDVVSLKKRKVPWWEEYEEDDIVAIDCEMVTKPKTSITKKYTQHVASVDIVDIRGKSVYSTLVYHEPGSFQDNAIFRELTGFHSQSFADRTLPSEEKVQQEVESILKNKLVVTLGGESDYRALGLDMGDFDSFDLQSHFYVEKTNEHGIIVREGHSLRSLAAYYTSQQQGKQHSSLKDAQLTMDLFNVYKKVKMENDEANCDSRYNVNYSYNHIPVLPNPLKRKK